MAEVKLSSKNQIVVPREAREALGAKPGSRLLVVVRNGNVMLLRKPRDYAAAVRRSMRGHYSPDHVDKERNSWK